MCHIDILIYHPEFQLYAKAVEEEIHLNANLEL